MKTTKAIKHLLLVGIVSLTLASCGGGGGGGGGSSSSSGHGSGTQGVSGNAPAELMQGLEFHFSNSENDYDVRIVDSTTCYHDHWGDAQYSYTSTGANSGTMTIHCELDGAGWTETYKLRFTDWTSGVCDWSDSFGDRDTLDFTVANRPARPTYPEDNDSSDNGSYGDSMDYGYAPASLQEGQTLSIVIGTVQGVTLGRAFVMTSPTTATVNSDSGTVEYEVTATDTAEFVYTGNGKTYMYTLHFDSPTSGTARKDGTGEPTAFKLESGHVDSPDDSGDDNYGDEGNPDDDSSDPGSDDTDVVGYAPDTMPIGCIFERIMPNGITATFRIDSATRGVIATSGMSFTYEYTKKNASSATFSVSPASGVTYSHDLVFTSPDSGTCVLHNSAGDYNCQFRIISASSDDDTMDDDVNNSDDNDTPAADLAPDDLNSYEFNYISSIGGTAFSFMNNGYNSNAIVRYGHNSSWCERGDYVYTKTGKTTATLSYSVTETNGIWKSETQGALLLTFNSNGTVTVSGSTIDTTVSNGEKSTISINETYRVVKD